MQAFLPWMSEETFARRRSSRVESSLVLKRIPSDDDVFSLLNDVQALAV